MWRDHKRPSAIMDDVLQGRLPYEEAPAAIQSACSINFIRAARMVLKGVDNKQKRDRLNRIPEFARYLVEEEIKKILRREKLESRKS